VIAAMPIPIDAQQQWLHRLAESPDQTVSAVADLIHAEADALPALHMLRIGDKHFNRKELAAVEMLADAGPTSTFMAFFVTDLGDEPADICDVEFSARLSQRS
jgi:hypothetical protein